MGEEKGELWNRLSVKSLMTLTTLKPLTTPRLPTHHPSHITHHSSPITHHSLPVTPPLSLLKTMITKLQIENKVKKYTRFCLFLKENNVYDLFIDLTYDRHKDQDSVEYLRITPGVRFSDLLFYTFPWADNFHIWEPLYNKAMYLEWNPDQQKIQ